MHNTMHRALHNKFKTSKIETSVPIVLIRLLFLKYFKENINSGETNRTSNLKVTLYQVGQVTNRMNRSLWLTNIYNNDHSSERAINYYNWILIVYSDRVKFFVKAKCITLSKINLSILYSFIVDIVSLSYLLCHFVYAFKLFLVHLTQKWKDVLVILFSSYFAGLKVC